MHSATFPHLFGQFGRMLTKLTIGGVLLVLLVTGCTDREAEARRAREEAEAKARAEAARKEMEAVPKAFKSRDYFKKNEPEKKPEQPAAAPKPSS
jgi:hypothetical protein